MSTGDQTNRSPDKIALDEDSAVAVLQHLNAERGTMFTESDYREMRSAVLDELAHGARLRPFTLFTFGIIVLGLIGLIAVGVVTARSHALRDQLLTIVSTLALLVTVGFVWNLIRGLRQEAERSLDTRLEELEQLRQRNLVTSEEYENILAHILIARQRSRDA